MIRKKRKPPDVFRIKAPNLIKLENIQEYFKLDNRNLTINKMIEEWDYVIKWLPLCSSMASFVGNLEKHKMGITLEEINRTIDTIQTQNKEFTNKNMVQVRKLSRNGITKKS